MIAHGPEMAETLSSIDRWLTVLAFVGSFALLLVLGEVLVSAWEWLQDRRLDHLGEALAARRRPEPALSLFDVHPRTGRIVPVVWTFEGGSLVEWADPERA